MTTRTPVNAVDAEKFVVRFDTAEMRTAIHDAAKARRLTMNTFILEAIENELGRGARMDALLDHCEKSLKVKP